MLKKLSQVKREEGGLKSFVMRSIRLDGSEEEILEEMAQWFLAVRDLSKQGALPSRFSLSEFIPVFCRIAEDKNIGADRFFSGVLEKMVLESEEVLRGAPKPSTKDKILDAALDVFSEKGFHLATVDEIAERAGVGKGTLYRYFANKETLFNELVQLRLDELEKSAMAILDGEDDVLTMITKYLRVYFEFFDQNQRLYRLIVQEGLDVGDQVQDLYFKKVMRRIPLLKRKIYGARQQGLLKDVDFHTVFYGVMGFMHGVIQKWLARDCSYSLVEELPGVVEVLFYGFVNTSKFVESQN
jgi:AcrR family transcriptional regulator